MADELAALGELLGIVRTLRAPGGCEWDRSQTVQSLRPFLLEEAYEAADAAAEGDFEALRTELGDLLLHVLMAAVIGEEAGLMDVASVAEGISAKLRRRHPHVFARREDLEPGEVEKQWERIKASEKRSEGFFGSVPASMPALQAAWRIQQRASEVGFEWPGAAETLRSLKERVEVLPPREDDPGSFEPGRLGELLFLFVNYCRAFRQEPEQLLRNACREFQSRFTAMEEMLHGRGTPLGKASPAQISAAWRDSAEKAGWEPGMGYPASAGKEHP